MITVHTESGSFTIPPEVVAEGEAACGAFAAAEVARRAHQPASTDQPTPSEPAAVPTGRSRGVKP